MQRLVKGTPERFSSGSKLGPVHVESRCRPCGRRSWGEYEYVVLNVTEGGAPDWDSVMLPRVIVCGKCGRTDEYELTKRGLAAVVERVRLRDPRVLIGESRTWDGTVVTRASQALRRLRELIVERSESAEAWRRLGNGCNRYGEPEEAKAAWKRASELDPSDVESLCSLASAAYYEDRIEEGFAHLQRAFAAFPSTKLRSDTREFIARDLFAILVDLLEEKPRKLAVVASYEGDIRPEVFEVELTSEGDLAGRALLELAVCRRGLRQLELVRESPAAAIC